MRMWLVDPKLLCNKHLGGEHVECHMFVGTIKRGTSLSGYIRNRLVNTLKLQERHDILAKEMECRGFKHASPLQYIDTLGIGEVDVSGNIQELKRRCPKCAERIAKGEGLQ